MFEQKIAEFLRYLRLIERSERTIHGYGENLTVFNRYLQDQYNCSVYLDEISTEDIEGFLLYLKQERETQASTRKRYLGTLRSLFKWAYKRGLVDRDVTAPIEPIKSQIKEKHYLSETEVQRFVEAVDHRLVKLIVQTMYYTGMRVSECTSLKQEHVDLKTGIIHVIKAKGNKDRQIPINGTLLDYLVDYQQNWKVLSEFFFATSTTGRISATRVATVVRETADRLGWKKGTVTPHSFRHAFASHLVKKNVNLVNVSKLLGHASLKTTSVYTHASLNDLKEAVNAF